MRSLRLPSLKILSGACGFLLLSPLCFTQIPDTFVLPGNGLTGSLAPTDSKSVWDLVVEVHVNGRTAAEMAHVLQPEPGKFYATADSFKDWRLTAPAAPVRELDGVKYFAIDSLPG